MNAVQRREWNVRSHAVQQTQKCNIRKPLLKPIICAGMIQSDGPFKGLSLNVVSSLIQAFLSASLGLRRPVGCTGAQCTGHWCLVTVLKIQEPIRARCCARLWGCWGQGGVNKAWLLTPRLLACKSGYKHLLMIWPCASYSITWRLSFQIFFKTEEKEYLLFRSSCLTEWEIHTKRLAQHLYRNESTVYVLHVAFYSRKYYYTKWAAVQILILIFIYALWT